MRTYKSVYPYFESLIDKVKFKLNQRLMFGRTTNEEKSFLLEILCGLEFLKSNLYKMPSISNVNFEQSINEFYKTDSELHGVMIFVSFYEDSDPSKYAVQRFNLGR